jgi:hypothetical protein
MRFLLLLLTVGWSAALLAQEPAKPPAELEALKHRYQQDIEAADKPVRDRYVASLQMLMRSLTAKGDLAGALVVQTELNAMKGPAALLLGLWHYHGPAGPGVREFHANGTFAIQPGGPAHGKWEITEDKLKLIYPDGSDEFPLPINPEKMIGRSSVNVDVTMSK